MTLAELKAKAAADWKPDNPLYGYAHNVKGADCKQYSYADYLTDMGQPIFQKPALIAIPPYVPGDDGDGEPADGEPNDGTGVGDDGEQ